MRAPKFAVATEADYADFAAYKCRRCFGFANDADAQAAINRVFGPVQTVTVANRVSFISEELSEAEAATKAAETGLALVSCIRVL